MKTMDRPGVENLVVDKTALRRLLDEQDRRSGFIPDRDITPQEVRAMMIADGIRPEDNEFSRDIMRMREGSED